MTPRKPTPEERTLWRESNRFTKKIALDDGAVEEVAEEQMLARPSSLRAETRWGAESGTNDGGSPAPTLPRRGRELAPLSRREAKRAFAAHPDIQATLDLHGLDKLAAYEQVQAFIVRQYRAGRRHVLIITGKGRGGEGVLRSALPHWLNEPSLRKMISAFAHGSAEKGGAGVMHVLIKAYKL